MLLRMMYQIAIFFFFVICLNSNSLAQNALVKINIFGKIPTIDSVYFSLTPKDSLPNFQKIVVPNNPMILRLTIGKEYVCRVEGKASVEEESRSFSKNINLLKAKIDEVFEVNFQFHVEHFSSDYINFLTNSTQIINPSREVLKVYTKVMKEDFLAYVLISGHTDTREKTPKQLSLKRAEWVRDELMKAGINPIRMRIESYGKDSPMVPDKVDGKWDKNNMALNRRVQMQLLRGGTAVYYVANLSINPKTSDIRVFQIEPDGQQYDLGKNAFIVFENKLIFELLKGYCYKFFYQTEKGEEKTWYLDLTVADLPNTVVEEIK